MEPLIQIKRHTDWEKKLEQFIVESRSKKFVRGQTDCVPFASDCVASYTGVQVNSRFRGKYNSDKEAFKLIRDHPEGFLGIVRGEMDYYGLKEKNRKLAKRGDLCFIVYEEDGQKHEAFAVCYGMMAVTPAKVGITLVPMSKAITAWGVPF